MLVYVALQVYVYLTWYSYTCWKGMEGMGYTKKKKKSILYLCTDYPGLEFEFTAVSMFFKLFTTTVTGRMCWSL